MGAIFFVLKCRIAYIFLTFWGAKYRLKPSQSTSPINQQDWIAYQPINYYIDENYLFSKRGALIKRVYLR
ncbi:MAG: hypothetical protein EBT63_07015 [Proteobacteria bacterium]|nr:hypothetical protein [Pseudomonadota bacterium]NCA29039.1 hypothetical protein [Pseudomonadota bacterium]